MPAGPAAGLAAEFGSWLRALDTLDGSDLHRKVGSPPLVRTQGRLERLDRATLTPAETESLAASILPDGRRARFEKEGHVDFAHSVSGVGRYRANVFRQRGSVSMVFRKLRVGGPSFEDIGLPPVVEKLSQERRGLILVTGPTGSGKTTTLASMIAYINAHFPVH